ncbi:MAG: two-component regulator propeller domain-containing protein [Candidatus Marinimicrobia bacterium]|nr:two-component regulator propeller domain-containing protein [Candidatus Neomarinimicrobiota bacterium]
MKKLSLFLLIIFIPLSCALFDPPVPEVEDITFIQQILDGYFVVSIAFEDDGTAWLGTLGGGYGPGLIKYETNGTTTIYDHTNSIINDSTTIRDIEVDKDGNVWIGNDGLICFDGNDFTRYSLLNENTHLNRVMSIASDSEGKVWFASWNLLNSGVRTGGLVSFYQDEFTVYTPDNSGLNEYASYDIEIDNNDNIWLAQNSSLVKFNGNTWTTYGSDDLGFEPFMICDIDITSQNTVVGIIDYTGFSGGMMFPSTGKPTLFSFDGINSQNVLTDSVFFQSLTVDEQDRIWCPNFHNLRVYNSRNLQLESIAPDNIGIFAIKESPLGEIWMGSGDGVYIYQK